MAWHSLQSIVHLCCDLQSLLMWVRKANPHMSQLLMKWVEKQYQLPIKQMDIITQVALILGVVCSIIIGVGTPGANFIMRGLSLLLYLAFQKPNGSLSLMHEDIMKLIPSTINTVLYKFPLIAKTVIYTVCDCHCTTYQPTCLDWRLWSIQTIAPISQHLRCGAQNLSLRPITAGKAVQRRPSPIMTLKITLLCSSLSPM